MAEKYDALIIGAGMSGLAAAIRLAMFDKKVCLLEKHSISGGLNSYYKRGDRLLDVGLHAMTNFIKKNEKGKPLHKLLKQLRIPYDSLKLSEQNYSKIIFPENTLKFSNDLETLKQEISTYFPNQIDGFCKLLDLIDNFDEVSLDNKFCKSKDIIKKYITNETLLEMIMCPLLIYGSAWENDMDFSQFVIMFKSIFYEGFSRPIGGVRTIIDLLIEKANKAGVEIRYKSNVSSINTKDNKFESVTLSDNTIIKADKLISSAGLPETMGIISNNNEEIKRKSSSDVGKLSFTETILFTKNKPASLGVDPTIIFYNNNQKYNYKRPNSLYDNSSAVICMPNNFVHDDFNEGVIRVTNMANYELWCNLNKEEYKTAKNDVLQSSTDLYNKISGNKNLVSFSDVFTPKTITRYTGHYQGTVYGSTVKSRDGKTNINGLYICGTDQGFLGIVGSMLSGISMANLHGLMD